MPADAPDETIPDRVWTNLFFRRMFKPDGKSLIPVGKLWPDQHYTIVRPLELIPGLAEEVAEKPGRRQIFDDALKFYFPNSPDVQVNLGEWVDRTIPKPPLHELTLQQVSQLIDEYGFIKRPQPYVPGPPPGPPPGMDLKPPPIGSFEVEEGGGGASSSA